MNKQNKQNGRAWWALLVAVALLAVVSYPAAEAGVVRAFRLTSAGVFAFQPYSATDKVSFRNIAGTEKGSIDLASGAIVVGSGTSTSMPYSGLTTPTAAVAYNATTGKLSVWTGAAWTAVH